MKKSLYNKAKRLLAIVLTLALVVGLMPRVAMPVQATITTSDMVQNSKVVDPPTIHNWKRYFEAVSTEYTGGVWTDKSVFQSFADYLDEEGIQNFVGPNGSAVSNDVMAMLGTDSANFLVAMSAITANKSISGSSSTPMDNMLVLDVSGSMQGDNAVAVVEATNRAIKTLLDQNVNNRVGVILYSGNHQQGNSQTNTASVLLPLGRYTTTDTMNVTGGTIPAYLTISGSGNNQTVYVAGSVNNGTASDEKTVRGGTYIQNGLYQAWQQFEKVTDVKVPVGHPQAGTQRIPVIVLMSDGAPTAATSNYNNVQTSNVGNGMNTSDRMGFLTQLTAAYVRGSVEKKYGTAPKFYSLGVGTGNDNVATSVLNPAGSSNTLTGYWTTFMNGTNGQNVQITSGWGGWSVYKDAAVAGKNYVDQYWLTSDATGLINAFNQIVNTIVLESEHFSTLVDISQGAHLSGYVTFEDELGELMEVKSVKGMVMGNTVFTGAELAKGMTSGVLGTVDGPTAAGDELVRTVKERMGIAETSVAQTLIDNAYNAGQLSYTDATHYSNYIGWYANEAGKYVGFWQESDGYAADNAPTDAKYINKSYGYLGAPLDQTGAGSDMMHIVVMVRTEIATGRQSVIYKIPASLLPSVTYHIELDGEDITKPKSLEREGADPMRLLFEVGLRSDINPVNIAQKVAEYDALEGTHIHANNDGTYTFYTNRWGSGDGSHNVNYDEPLTHLVAESHFHPALENERYYHVEDDLVYSDQNGTVYTGSARPAAGYFARPYYEKDGGVVRYTVKYAPINPTVLDHAQEGDNGWYIPEGTAHSLARFALAKEPNNPTDTLDYSWNPVILHDNEGYHSYTFLGNNGTFTVAPAQGISLKKTVTEEVENAPTTFQFKVTLSEAVTEPKVTDPDGNPLENIHTVSGNVITVNIKKDQTVVITGIPTGVTYTVEEVPNGYYTPTIQNATGAVAANTVTKVEVKNVPRIFNDLIVSKDIIAPDWMTDISALETQEFQIRVQVEGADANTAYTTSVTGTTLQTDGSGNGTVTFTLKDGQSATVNGLPAGATYRVQEINVPAGYTSNTQSAITGEIPTDSTAVARVLNTYAPQEASVNFNMAGAKNFHNGSGPVADGDWPAEGFTVNLYRIEGGSRQPVQTVNVTAAAKSWEKSVTQTFTKTGVYRFQIVEEKGSQSDIVYDATSGLFEIVVIDDGTGQLKVSQIRPVEDTVDIAVNGSSVSVITKNFENYKEAGSVTIPVEKVIEGSTTISKNEFAFGLYDGNTLVETIVGDGSFVIAGYAADFATAKQYTIKEIIPAVEDRIVGMTYDDAVYTVNVVWDDVQNKLTYSFDGTTETTAEFTNAYAPYETPEIILRGGKTMDGDRTTFLGNESYTFELYKTGANFVESGNPVDTDTVSGSDYTYAFDGLTFTEEGTYYYVVKEKAGTQGGVTYDTTKYHVTVFVKKAVDGNKTILTTEHTVTKFGTTETVADSALNFTNIYKITQSASVTVHGLKKLTGRELIAGEFEFGLYENGSLVESVKNATNGKFTFSPITYTAPGTHTYTVKEIVPANKLGGVTYSNEEYTVKVEVTDNGAGGLNVKETITLPNASVASYDDLIITNTYEMSPKTVYLTGTKTWRDTDANADKTVPADRFSFTLYKADEHYNRGDVVKTVKNGANGSISISLTYTKPGTHYYVLHEDMIKDAEAPGYDPTVAYDAGRYLIRDVVTDDGVGGLTVLRTVVRDGVGAVAPNAVNFGNLYTPVATEAVISGTKSFSGRPLALQNGEFTFRLFEGDTLLEEVQNVGDTFTFTAIPYEKSGTYTYKVVEKLPDGHVNGVKNGITYDDQEYTVTITVADDNGQLKATASHTPAQLVFTNTYDGEGTQISVSGIKNFNKAMTGGEFTFELYEGNNLLATQTNGASTPGTNNTHNAGFTFVIPLESAGEHTFTLKERNGGDRIDGVAYCPEVYTITVNVTDNNSGQLVAGTPVITKGGSAVSEIKFQNSYSVAPTNTSLQITKKMIGDRTQLLDGETYTFQLYEGSEYIMQAQNDQSGAVKFNGIVIKTPGTHVFTIREFIPTDAVNNVKDGVTYTTVEITATVEVTDNGDGTLTAGTPVYTSNGILENTYTLTDSVSFDLVGEKRMEGRELKNTDTFTFIMKDPQGKTVATAQNSGNIIRFEGVELTDLGDHYFTVVEQAPTGGTKDGVTYSTEVYDVYVRVSDNGVGQMMASAPVVTKGGAAKELVFTNTYAVTEGTTTDIEGKKILRNDSTLTNQRLKADQFTFALYAGTDTTAQPIATAKNRADGSFKFADVELNTLGTNTFTVMEQAPQGGKLEGVTYSNLVYTVKVETTDNGVGGMTAGQPAYYLGGAVQQTMEFINTYGVEGEVPATIRGAKTLEGGKKLEANMFTFELYKNDQLLGRAQNAADGTVTFNLTYGKNDIGKHTYAVKEVAPAGYEADGIRYTDKFYYVDILVEDNGVGGLKVNAPVYRLGDDVKTAMEFVNVYTPADKDVTLTVKKTMEVLSGTKQVGPDGFQFKITDASGATVATVTSDKDGNAAHTLTFRAADIGKTYTYKITEVNTGKAGVTYSNAVYEVTVAVGQAQTGELTTAITVNGAAADAVVAAFRNTYEIAETPKTGDTENLVLYSTLMALSALGFVAMLILRKKEEHVN